MSKQTRFSFGAASSLITNLGLIVGLDVGNNAKTSIISGILLIALADNISDSFGIHLFQESESKSHREVWFSTFSNFFTRFFISLSFIIIIYLLPLPEGTYLSLLWGTILLIILSYLIAKKRKVNILRSICEHISIAFLVITASHFLGQYIISRLNY